MEGSLEVGEVEAARKDLGVGRMTRFGVGLKHLASDLGVAWFVGPHQPKLVAAEERDKAVEQDERRDGHQYKSFGRGGKAKTGKDAGSRRRDLGVARGRV